MGESNEFRDANEGIIFFRENWPKRLRAGMEKGDTGANRPETATKADNDIDTSFSLISLSGKHWFFQPRGVTCGSLSPVSCSIDTAVERIEPKPGNETQSRCCRATNLLAASPAITDRLGLPIEMGTFRAFASSKRPAGEAFIAQREREKERKNHRCNFGGEFGRRCI